MNTDANKLINTDGSAKPELLYADLTYKIRGAIFNVSNKYGKSLKEQIYQKALAEEFTKLNIKYIEQPRVVINSLETGKQLGHYVPDFLVENAVIVEIKSTDFISEKYRQQQLSYLKGSVYELGLLVNFGTPRLEIERFIYTNDHKSKFLAGSIRVNQ